MQRILLFVSLTSLISCASITSGVHEQIRVTSSPAAADAMLTCNGQTVASSPTPATFTIRRNAGDCDVKLSKEGFDDATVLIEQGVNPAYWMNMIFTPLAPGAVYLTWLGNTEEKMIGISAAATALAVFGADFWTGAVHTHRPHAVDVVMKPKSPPEAAR